MEIGDLVFGRLKNNTSFQGSVIGIIETGIKVKVDRCHLSPPKVGKEYNVPKKNIKKIVNIKYDKLSNYDLWHISTCMGYRDLEDKSGSNEASMPYDTEPTKKQLAIYDENLKTMREELKEKIQSEFFK